MPLFPLHTVLFPFAPMQLHVFEERYREMVRFCRDFDSPFGVVLIRSGDEVGGFAEPYLVGTAVRIEYIQQYDDGRMDVRVRGERRFRVRKLDESRPYLVGLVEPVSEAEPDNQERVEALAMRARESFRNWVQSAFNRPELSVQVNFPDDPVAMSFLMANYLPLENLEKQRMLEQVDTGERLADLIVQIEHHVIESEGPDVERVTSEHLADWIQPN